MLRREILQKLNNFVHLNLCTALACGLLVFLVGIEGAKSNDVSSTVNRILSLLAYTAFSQDSLHLLLRLPAR